MKGTYIFYGLIALIVPFGIINAFSMPWALLGIAACYFALLAFIWQSKKAYDLEKGLK